MAKEADKAALRKVARLQRRSVDRATVSAAACAILVEMVRDRFRGQIVAGYQPIGTEMNPVGAMVRCHAMGCALCVPVVEGSTRDLMFGRWTPGMRMVRGRFGIAVPAVVEAMVPAVLIVPLLAYDGAGWRLGYGGGYYDRTLACLRSRGEITAIGFAAGSQRIDAVPHACHDQPLDWVVTETGAMKCFPDL